MHLHMHCSISASGHGYRIPLCFPCACFFAFSSVENIGCDIDEVVRREKSRMENRRWCSLGWSAKKDEIGKARMKKIHSLFVSNMLTSGLLCGCVTIRPFPNSSFRLLWLEPYSVASPYRPPLFRPLFSSLLAFFFSSGVISEAETP